MVIAARIVLGAWAACVAVYEIKSAFGKEKLDFS
jgi:hypothetical protein